MSFFRKLLLVLFAGFIANGFSQNLIPNASFENIDYCDNLQNLFPLCTPWLNPSITPSFPTPNVFNECAEIFQDGFGIPVNIAGYQYARTGKGYGGIVTYSDYEEGRDYISVKLFNTLDANRTYCIEYYVSLPNYDTTVQPNGGSRYAIDCMGAFLSDTIFHQYNGDTITAIPQIINTPGYFLRKV